MVSDYELIAVYALEHSSKRLKVDGQCLFRFIHDDLVQTQLFQLSLVGGKFLAHIDQKHRTGPRRCTPRIYAPGAAVSMSVYAQGFQL